MSKPPGDRPASTANYLTFDLSPLTLAFSLQSLETFAATGELTETFGLLARFVPAATLQQLRQVMQIQIRENPTVISQFIHCQMGDELLHRLGNSVRSQPGVNGADALKLALMAAVKSAAGLTPLNVLRQFPGDAVRVDVRLIGQLWQEWKQLAQDRDRAIATLIQQSHRAAATTRIDFTQRPDLRLSGPFTVSTHLLTVPLSPPTAVEELQAIAYLPADLPHPAPLVVVSHGLGALPDNYPYLANHLASHGIAVAVLSHRGSDRHRLYAFMNGEHRELMEPQEFLYRRRELSALLDHLERRTAEDPQWQNKIDLERTGILGISFGGTTALALGGATLNRTRLPRCCGKAQSLTLNLSTLLQCTARQLPDDLTSLRDLRIKAAIAAFPPTSLIFGQEGMANVSVPTLMVTASRDQLTPPVAEQIQPFSWLSTADKYLALLDPGNHFTVDASGSEQRMPDFMRGDRPDPEIGRSYLKALSVAFFHHYLCPPGDLNYSDYLSAAYAQTISQASLRLHLVR